MDRTAWTRPELIVLVRNTAEETVLAACKTGTGLQVGPQANNQGCGWVGGSCAACQSRPAKAS